MPCTYCGFGGIAPDSYRRAEVDDRIGQDIPTNHSPSFAPVIQPTLDVGTRALVTDGLAWLAG